MTNGRDWLSVILEDQGVPLHLVMDEPVSIHTPLKGPTRLEFTLRINLTDEEFSEYTQIPDKKDAE